MIDERAGNARIEHHRHAAGRYFARIEPLDRARAGAPPDLVGGFEIAGVERRGEIVILLHAGALAGDRRHRHRMPRAERGAAKAVARHQHHAADAGRGRGAAGFAYAFDAERGFLRLARVPLQAIDARHVGIEQIEIGEVAGEQRRIGKAGKLVLRRDARHGDGAFGQRLDAIGPDVVCRDRGLAFADQHAQADVVAFGALRFLDRAVAHVDR